MALDIYPGALPGQTHLGTFDAIVRKYDVNGNEAWTRQFGTATDDQALAVSATAHLSTLVAGQQVRCLDKLWLE